MSRPEKTVKGSTTSQLKKDLSNSGKVLQSLTNSLEKLESTLTDAEIALTNERSLKEELSSVQRQNAELREELNKAKIEHQGEVASFTTANLKHAQEYQARVNKLGSECESKIKEYQRREEVMESKWQQKVEFEKAETQRLKQVESHGRHEIEGQLRRAKEDWQKREEQFQIDLRQRDHQIVELSNKTKTLTQDLTDHETILKGREKEMQKLGARLSALEAFPPQDGTDKLTDMIARMQTSLREFCLWCVDSVETLPGWSQVPDGIRYDHLPKFYSPDSGAGCYVFAAAIQHSICEAMKQNFLPPLGPYADRKLWAVSEALFQSNESHEAIWRLMTVNAILGDQRMVDEYKARLREVATSLLSSWKPFPGDNQKKETLDRLTGLLTDCATVSLELQKIRKRIHVSTHVVSEYFDSDSEEDLYKVPGGFELPDSTAPVLCLFPAFFGTASPAADSQPTLIRKGTAMFRDSPPLLAALNDEREVRSPRMTSKRRPTT